VDWINVAGCCYHDSEHLGFKNVGIFWLPEELVASKEDLCHSVSWLDRRGLILAELTDDATVQLRGAGVLWGEAADIWTVVFTGVVPTLKRLLQQICFMQTITLGSIFCVMLLLFSFT
jgi:hypothetical protein